MQAAYEALSCLKSIDSAARQRTGVILGNISTPTKYFNEFAAPFFLEELLSQTLSSKNTHPINRFMSGTPAFMVSKALSLGGDSFSIDATCASGLYSIKLACDKLHTEEADIMLAGAVSAVEQPFLHIVFSALKALSPTGQSRPFCQHADGVLLTEGAAFVALKRLKDAIDDNDQIFGIIRGIGLSNSGRSGSFIAPSLEGEVDAISKAYSSSSIDPDDISYIECHATGTSSGDTVEVMSINKIFNPTNEIVISSAKANIGHSMTVAGLVGLIKIVGCFYKNYLPSTPNAFPLISELKKSNLRVLKNNEQWTGTQRAGLNAFGLGGNNAHLIVEKWTSSLKKWASKAPIQKHKKQDVAIVGLGIKSSFADNIEQLHALLMHESLKDSVMHHGLHEVEIDIHKINTPPKDLYNALGQQLLLLPALEEALKNIENLDSHTGIYIGMGTDPETSRFNLRIKLPDILEKFNATLDANLIDKIKDAVSPALDSYNAVGMMSQLVANRLSTILSTTGPSFSVSCEELSGDMALKAAIDALSADEINAAIVGAVDLSDELIHRNAISHFYPKKSEKLSNVAIILVAKTLNKALQDGDTVLAIINSNPNIKQGSAYLKNTENDFLNKLACSHATTGLFNTFCCALLLSKSMPTQYHSRFFALSNMNTNKLDSDANFRVRVTNEALFGFKSDISISPSLNNKMKINNTIKNYFIKTYVANSKEELIKKILGNNTSDNGGVFRLGFVTTTLEEKKLVNESIQLLHKNESLDHWVANNIVFSKKPIVGQLGFVFTGVSSEYPGMVDHLLTAFPRLVETCSDTLHKLIINEKVDCDLEHYLLPENQSKGTAILSQLHAGFSLNMLDLKPDAVIGFSMGEINGLIALGVWNDLDHMINDVSSIRLYDKALSGEYLSLKKYWQLDTNTNIQWKNYLLSSQAEFIQDILKSHEHVYLTIIYTKNECVISGEEQACQIFLKSLPDNINYIEVNHSLAFHCEAIQLFEPELRKIYTRPINSLPTVRFYSNHFQSSYELTVDNISNAILGQAMNPINFPATINQAWNDGVRIFLEHGPRNHLSSAIDKILTDKDHIAIALNCKNKPPLEQLLLASIQLWSIGVNINFAKLTTVAHYGTHSGIENVNLIKIPLRLPSIKNIAYLLNKTDNAVQNQAIANHLLYENELIYAHNCLSNIYKSYLNTQIKMVNQYYELVSLLTEVKPKFDN